MRLIDAELLWRKFSINPKTGERYKTRDCDNFYIDVHLESVQREIISAPTVDAVEIVRCKNCKFWKTEECRMDDWFYSEVEENDFCSKGERKDKE